MKLFPGLFFFAVILTAAHCTNNQTQPGNTSVDTLPEKKIPLPEKEKIEKVIVTYHSLALSDSVVANIKSLHTMDEMATILALNRIDWVYLRIGDTLIVPDTFFTDLKMYSPFPDSLGEIKQVKKIIFISYPVEAFAAYETGKLIRWGPASLGKRSTPTPTGLFFTNWKSKQDTSTVNGEWILKWYFNFENFEGVSLHQYDLPGYPASHSCVRLNADDAQWIYYWAEQWVLRCDTIAAYGTPVIIFGSYQFGQRPCWTHLTTESSRCNVLPDSLMREINSFLPTIMERQISRDSLKAL
ncbi:MAG TPA: L,D-transpeptidase [Chitinophagales bacterium]|nr:L,D-transpeptidase [Chitinophagales bacterium]